MLYQSSQNLQNHPFHLVSPSPWPLFTNIPLVFNDLFVGVQNILSRVIDNNLSNCCYLLLIIIFSILLIILLFILVSHSQKGYSVKMNNLPNSNNGNSGSNNGNSGSNNVNSGSNNGNSNNGNSGSNNRNSNNGNSGSNNGNSYFNWIHSLVLVNEADENSCLNHFKAKYELFTREKNMEFISTKEQIQDTFPKVYSEYKKSKVNNPDLNWKNFTDIYYCTWDKHPLGSLKYEGNDEGFNQALESIKKKKEAINSAITLNKPELLPKQPYKNTGILWRESLGESGLTLTTFKIYMEIIDNITR